MWNCPSLSYGQASVELAYLYMALNPSARPTLFERTNPR